MKFDKLSCFCEKVGSTVFKIPVTASTSTPSQVVDLRLNDGNLDCLYVYATIVGTKNTAGAITTKLQTSDNGTSWSDVVSSSQDGNTLIAMRLPEGLKRFIRLSFGVGGTALNAAMPVKAGLVDNIEDETIRKFQSYPPLEDIASSGDGVVTAH